MEGSLLLMRIIFVSNNIKDFEEAGSWIQKRICEIKPSLKSGRSDEDTSDFQLK